MSIKQTGARLWFETQAEIDDYDTLMISNIELKSEDYDDDNFTIIATRKRKEIMPGNHTSLFNKTLSNLESFVMGKTHIRLGETGSTGSRSLLINQQYYMELSQLNWILGYLVLRELPIRNFWARSVIMTVYVTNYLSLFGIPFSSGRFHRKPMIVKPGFHHEKERQIYHWFQETDAMASTSEFGKF